jgi:hypothetical protein
MATADYPRDAVPPRNSSTPSPDTSATGTTDAGTTLRHHLSLLAARRNARHLWLSVARAAVVGTMLAAVLMLAHRLYLVDAPWWAPVILVAASLVIGYRNGTLRRAGLFDAALDADHTLGLQERLSSAIAFVQPDSVRRVKAARANGVWSRVRAVLLPRVAYETPHSTALTDLVPALVQDAASRAARLDPKEIYPVKVNRTLKLLAASVLALIVFSLMPNIEWLRTPEQRALAGVLNREGKELEAIAKEVRTRKETPANTETKKLAKRLEDLGRQMQRGRMAKKEALVSMGQLRKDLQKAGASDKQGGGLPNLEQVEQALREESMQSVEGQKMQEELARRDYEKAAQQLEKLAEKMELGNMTQQEREKAANDMEKAAKALRQSGNDEAARQMEEAAKSLRQQNQGGKQGNQKQGQQQGGQQQGGKAGQQGKQGQQQSGQQGSGADALRKMAKGLRESGTTSGNSQALRDMMKKIEEAEKDTGQNSGEQSGQGGQQGEASGQGQGKGQEGEGSAIMGKDLKPTTQGPMGGPGLGPRSGDQPRGKGGGVSNMKSKSTGDKRRWEDVWSDRLPKTSKKLERIQGKMGSNGEVEQLPTRTEAEGGPVKTPYYEVYESYKKDAEDAVSKETVPPAYKRPVKEYFESINPGQ